jgi:hypothetical protein
VLLFFIIIIVVVVAVATAAAAVCLYVCSFLAVQLVDKFPIFIHAFQRWQLVVLTFVYISLLGDKRDHLSKKKTNIILFSSDFISITKRADPQFILGLNRKIVFYKPKLS